MELILFTHAWGGDQHPSHCGPREHLPLPSSLGVLRQLQEEPMLGLSDELPSMGLPRPLFVLGAICRLAQPLLAAQIT